MPPVEGPNWLARVRGLATPREERGGAPPDARPEIVGSETLDGHLDGARTADGRTLVIHGWVAGIDTGTLYLSPADQTGSPLRLDPIVTPRADVSAHLANLGRTVTTDRHGFVATVSQPQPWPPMMRLCLVANGKSSWSPAFDVKIERVPLTALLGITMAVARQANGRLPDTLERLARPLLDQVPAPPAVVEVRRFGPPMAGTPRVSIVIPFYGEGHYLLDHLDAQNRAPMDVEWVMVCDDPRLSNELTQTISNRQSAIRQATSIVYLGSNGGYAHANNIGAAHAKGRYLLLMNSDVYCSDFTFLERGVSILEQNDQTGCVGFSMQFEDGTVQHDGMEFRRVPWFDDLWASEHPRKGMPHDWPAPPQTSVEGVTAALMLLRRADFADAQIFDPGYVVGDFEDGDLCLRLRQQGRTLALVRTQTVWHLERQSVRHVADNDGRRAITLLNCLRFNARWGAMLERDAQARGLRP
ncbi:MAG TPA: glycosyltransferase [Vicinamibacterales bacterium]|nr:glycosyltransferase [Vicinamibacterales bacterium]